MDMMLKKLLLSLCLALSLSTAVLAVERVDINTATQSQLEMLNGIGASTATAIIHYRDQHGAFHSVDELVNVKGIGEKKLAKLAEDLTASQPE
jgi:competence protein ComEA